MWRNRRRSTIALLVVLVAGTNIGAAVEGSGIARAATIYYVNGAMGSNGNDCTEPSPVSGQPSTGPCQTITGAILKASSGDTIDIAGGVYCEEISVDAALTLQALDPTDSPAIDGGHGSSVCGGNMPLQSVVTVGDSSGSRVSVALRELTVQNGDASNNPTDGARQPGLGGGIFVFTGATLMVTDSSITGNVACSQDTNTSCGSIGDGVASGGGIANNGTLELIRSMVNANAACDDTCGTGGFGEQGGGIYTRGATILINSTVSGNSACTNGGSDTCSGGGILAAATTTLVNSTVGGNYACNDSGCSGYGGGLENVGGTTNLINATVSGNSACSAACGQGGIGGIDTGLCGEISGSTTTLTNTILAGNGGWTSSSFCSDSSQKSAQPDCHGSFADGNPSGTGTVGHNVIGDGDGCGLTNGKNGDQVGTGSSPLDPKVAPLANNGGPPTMALLAASPAIGVADRPTCTLATLANGAPGPAGKDERGEPRSSLSCDIGAYQTIPTVYVATIGSDANTCASSSVPCRHIAKALAVVEPSDGSVHIAGGTYQENLSLYNRTVTLTGPASGTAAVIDGGGKASVAQLLLSDVTFTYLTFQNGGGTAEGAGIDATHSTVTLSHDTISHNTASGGTGEVVGGGIALVASALNMDTSTVSGNQATATATDSDGNGYEAIGGGLYADLASTALVTHSTISGNTATGANGIENPSSTATVQGSGGQANGAGIFAYRSLAITTSTISGNVAQGGAGVSSQDINGGGGGSAEGGGILVYGSGACGSASGPVQVTASLIEDNTARGGDGGGAEGNDGGSGGDGAGGGIFGANCAPFDAYNSTFSNNTAQGGKGGEGGGTAGNGGNGSGGGLYGSQFANENLTVADNAAAGGAAGQGILGGSNGSPGQAAGGGLWGGANVSNTILYNNTGGNCNADVSPANDDLQYPDSSCGPSLETLDPQLATAPAANGGPTDTIALTSGSPANGHGDGSTCQDANVNNEDQRGWPRHADTRATCDIGAYDTGGPNAIAKGWTLIDVPVQSSTTATMSGLAGSLNGALGAGAITALATYTHGVFALYVAGYSANHTRSPSQGIFVLSRTAGSWLPPGTAAYPGGQNVNLQAGWNLVAAPYPYLGLDGSAINREVGAGCGLQEVVTYNGGYQAHVPTDNTYHVSATSGMWMLCTKSFVWTPSL